MKKFLVLIFIIAFYLALGPKQALGQATGNECETIINHPDQCNKVCWEAYKACEGATGLGYKMGFCECINRAVDEQAKAAIASSASSEEFIRSISQTSNQTAPAPQAPAPQSQPAPEQKDIRIDNLSSSDITTDTHQLTINGSNFKSVDPLYVAIYTGTSLNKDENIANDNLKLFINKNDFKLEDNRITVNIDSINAVLSNLKEDILLANLTLTTGTPSWTAASNSISIKLRKTSQVSQVTGTTQDDISINGLSSSKITADTEPLHSPHLTKRS